MRTKTDTPWERIQYVIRKHGFDSVSQFARAVGLDRGEGLYQIKRGNSGVSKQLAAKISATFPDVDEYYMLTGRHTTAMVDIPFYATDPVRRYRAGSPPDDVITMPYKGQPALSFATVNNEHEPVCGVLPYAVIMVEEMPRDNFTLGKPHLIETQRSLILRNIGDDEPSGHYLVWSDNPGIGNPRVLEAAEIISIYRLRYILNRY